MRLIHSFEGGLVAGRLIKRYKRFLADVRLEDGTVAQAFCPNTGSMTGLLEEGNPVLMSRPLSAGRKTAYTLEMIRAGRTWVGVQTHLTNSLAAALIRGGEVFEGYRIERAEAPAGRSRLDFLLEDEAGERMYVEVKSVTLRVGRDAMFPDAVTERGARHLEELVSIIKGGGRAAMLYLVQRADCRCFAPARHIDPAYASAYERARSAGVRVEARALRFSPEGVHLKGNMPLCGP